MSKLEKPKETSKEVATTSNELISNLVLNGDLSKMNDVMKVQYYNQLCHSLNLNPVTRPFQLISFQGKQVLYATKDATEQLRKLNGVSVVELTQEIKDGLCISKCKVQDHTNRYDIATGVTVTAGLKGGDLANSIMKSETKAKRRATLSICGLGMLDESELDTMPNYTTSDVTAVKVTEGKKETAKPVIQGTFSEKVINYMSTLTDKDSLDKAFSEAKNRQGYHDLDFREQMRIEDAYTKRTKKITGVTVEDIIKEEFDAVEVEQGDAK